MANPESFVIDPNPILNANDAFYMGQIHELGLALPNDVVLKTPAAEVTPQMLESDRVQAEIDLMIHIAKTIEGGIGIFGGLAHNQLLPTDTNTQPLQIFLAPAGIPGAPAEVEAKYGEFQVLVNTSFKTPPKDSPLWVKSKEGCSSSAITSTLTETASEIYDTTALNRFGEPVQADVIERFPAASMQHEWKHGQGFRRADVRGILRNIVHRTEVDEYRTFLPEESHLWHRRQSDEGWDTMTSPDYNLFPTPELQDAFEAGKADIRARGLM